MRRSRRLFGGSEALVFEEQLFLSLCMLGIERYAIHGTDLLALRLVEMADAFGAQSRIDDVDLRPLRDGAVGTFRFAHVAVDAGIDDLEGHAAFIYV
jgi:hypothetical protein